MLSSMLKVRHETKKKSVIAGEIVFPRPLLVFFSLLFDSIQGWVSAVKPDYGDLEARCVQYT